jgi:DNA-binding SARP family transcriptional activator
MSTSRFGELLRSARAAVGLSQRELAVAAGLSLAAVRDLEQGRSVRPRARSVESVIAALGLTGEPAQALRRSVRDAPTPNREPASGTDGPLRVEILGQLVARRGSMRLRIGPGKGRVILGRLALTPNVSVHAAELCELLWGPDVPASAVATLQVQMSRLRATLGGAVLPRTGAGYTLALGEDALDLARFRHLVRRAGRAGAGPEAARLLEEALRLWRGDLLAGVPELHGHALAEGAVQEHVAAVLRFADLVHAIGEAGRSLPFLRELAAAHALHEPVQARFIRTLAAAGRRADALRAYEEVRRRLADELGVDPGDELRATHLRILRGSGGGAAAGRPVPSQLPADIDGFTGRGEDLARLDTLLVLPADVPRTVVPVVVVCGTPGVGKTALAVRWGHSVRDRFPDGQLYVNMRGYDHREPITAAAALAGFLRALGVDDQQIPVDVDERAARFRSEVSGRRILIVIDNAATVDQARPLLPGSPSCAALVTSRDSLAGLSIRDGARRVELDLFRAADAVALLGTLIGDRARAEPGAVAALAERCARLPLALRIAAELAASRPHTTLGDLAVELADQRSRLDHLDPGGDQETTVTAVFSWSLRNVAPATATLFALLGQHPGADFDAYAVAALAGLDVGRARRELETLRRAHLVESADGDRYAMHDLLRAYAASLDPGDPGAVRRLIDFYVATTSAATRLVSPAEFRQSDLVDLTSVARPLATAAAAVEWLNRERANLVAVVGLAARGGWPAHAIELSVRMVRYLQGGGHHHEALSVHQHAEHAAALLGDSAARGRANLYLGTAYHRICQSGLARVYLNRAVAICRDSADAAGQGRALTNLGVVEKMSGSYRQAADHYLEGLALLRQAGDRVAEAGTLTNLGSVYRRLGDHRGAVACQNQALAIFQELGDRHGEAMVTHHLGEIEAALGNYEAARAHHERALASFGALDYRIPAAHVLDGLGVVHTGLGRVDRAIDYHHQALEIFRDFVDRRGEASALNGLGEASWRGDETAAQRHHTDALEIARRIDAPDQQARAHFGLGRIAERRGAPAAARDHYVAALDLYRGLGTPEADETAARLAALEAVATG